MSDYTSKVSVIFPVDLRRLIEQAAEQQFTDMSSYICQAVTARLKPDGWERGKAA